MKQAKIGNSNWNYNKKIALGVAKESFGLIGVNLVVRIVESLILLLKIGKIIESADVSKVCDDFSVIEQIPLFRFKSIQLAKEV